MPDVLIAPGSIKSLKDCKVGAGGVKDVIEIDIGVGGQVYKVWPSVVPYEDGTDLLTIGGIKYTGYLDDATGTTDGKVYTSWGSGVGTNKVNGSNVWNELFWYVYPDVNVAQIDYLYCNYFYAQKGNADSTYATGGVFYCSVADDPATNISKDTHKVSYSCTVSRQYSLYWKIDMRNISTGILKLGFYANYAVRGGVNGGGYSGNVHLKHLYSYTEEPTFPSAAWSRITASSTMT